MGLLTAVTFLPALGAVLVGLVPRHLVAVQRAVGLAVALLLNLVATQVDPLAVSGPFLSPFARLRFDQKAQAFALIEGPDADLVALLKDPNTCIYVCGLKSMEEGVVLALRDVAEQAGLAWDSLGAALKREGRLNPDTD